MLLFGCDCNSLIDVTKPKINFVYEVNQYKRNSQFPKMILPPFFFKTLKIFSSVKKWMRKQGNYSTKSSSTIMLLIKKSNNEVSIAINH